MQQNMFANLQQDETEMQTDEDRPTESPFMGNHVVKTVRNLKRIG